MRKPHAFVTDGSYVNTLAIVRALGHAGTDITVGERTSTPRSRRVACWSRYCTDCFSYADPDGTCDATVAALKELFLQRRYDIFIPVGLTMTELSTYHMHEFQTCAMLPSVKSFEIAADKKRTFEFATVLGIPVPVTVDLPEHGKLGYPS